jgi:tetratricopeptide (TPR) repeat protein
MMGQSKERLRILRSAFVADHSRRCSLSETTNKGRFRAFLLVMALLGATIPLAIPQPVPPQLSNKVTIRGRVLDAAGMPVPGASVHLEQKDASCSAESHADANGVFVFSELSGGTFTLVAEKSGIRSHASSVIASTLGAQPQVDLVLEASSTTPSNSNASSNASIQSMEFADKPNFTVAGVTDWTAAGGHGSDASLRTSEALTRETLTLRPNDARGSSHNPAGDARRQKESEGKLREALNSDPGSFEANHQLGKFYLNEGRYRESIAFLQSAFRIDPENFDNEYELARACKDAGDISQAREHIQRLLANRDNADLHRLAGETDEKLGDPLAAVHEYEQAVRLDPSEQNYFEWGSELLFHRAVWQAKEVFERGVKAYPKSARMLTALGAALFAGALYDEAALRLCDASDLNPTDAEPYIFMGKIEIAAPSPLACAEQKLARFLKLQPGNPLASYFYAMTVWKQQGPSVDQQTVQKIVSLLTKAVAIDPKSADAYLQLGNLYSSQRNYPVAIDFYTKAIGANPQLSEAHYRLALAYDRVGNQAEARQEFQLHDEIEKQQAAAIERQRREVKQFVVVMPRSPDNPPN